eukprot:4678533-Prorocentrum_lima.AAC.1
MHRQRGRHQCRQQQLPRRWCERLRLQRCSPQVRLVGEMGKNQSPLFSQHPRSPQAERQGG